MEGGSSWRSGILFMVHSLWAFIFYVPLFLATSVLSIVAMAQGRVRGGLTLLLCCVIIPPIAFVYCLGLMAQRLQASDSLKSRSPSPGWRQRLRHKHNRNLRVKQRQRPRQRN